MFEHLAPPLQRILWERGWKELRESQVKALPLILDTREDVVISAATATGKTEAAFLPLLTRLWAGTADAGQTASANKDRAISPSGVILYVAPVKALINDQAERLSIFCERMAIPVYPWHGDVGQTSRRRFFAQPRGVVLITPESLEALLFRRGSESRQLFANLQAVVVDELHAFIGNVRGMQLQSLLHRLEAQLGARCQRIGLSATLGDIGLAAEFLRPGQGSAVHVIVAASEKRRLQLTLKAVVAHANAAENTPEGEVVDALFQRLRDANYLIFPSGVGMVEFYADALRARCEAEGLPVTFFPHHGRLAKSEREETEVELKCGHLPVSAICTTTLEMGIDIGAIKGVVQIGSAPSVASLCQRIGRAGRREGDVAVLWQYCIGKVFQPGMGCVAGLHEDLVQAMAVIQLFIAKWYEPPRGNALHYSTLIQQILSLIGERHGVTATHAYELLCQTGPFGNVSEVKFIALLRALIAKDLVMQDPNRLLLHGALGEKLANHFTFYAAFPDTQEYRLRQAGRELGTLPLPGSSTCGDVITFAGRRWRIEGINHEKRLVELMPSRIGELPRTGGSSLPVHGHIRQQMREILVSCDVPPWLDMAAQSLLGDARRQFKALQLDKAWHVQEARKVYIFAWEDDRVQDAICLLLTSQGLTAKNLGLCIEVIDTTALQVEKAVANISAQPCPTVAEVVQKKHIRDAEKWDWVLPEELQVDGYASRALEIVRAHGWCYEVSPHPAE